MGRQSIAQVVCEAPCPLLCRPQGVQFMRHLVLAMLKAHHRGSRLRPRVSRMLPVSA